MLVTRINDILEEEKVKFPSWITSIQNSKTREITSSHEVSSFHIISKFYVICNLNIYKYIYEIGLSNYVTSYSTTSCYRCL